MRRCSSGLTSTHWICAIGPPFRCALSRTVSAARAGRGNKSRRCKKEVLCKSKVPLFPFRFHRKMPSASKCTVEPRAKRAIEARQVSRENCRSRPEGVLRTPRGDEGENTAGRCFHPRSNENREWKDGALLLRAATIFSEGQRAVVLLRGASVPLGAAHSARITRATAEQSALAHSCEHGFASLDYMQTKFNRMEEKRSFSS